MSLAYRRIGVVGVAATITGVASYEYWLSPGLRRSARFWAKVGPLIVEYKAIKLHAWYADLDDKATDISLSAFHNRTAPRVVDLILSLGGIYVKLGQLISTLGSGVFEDAYIQAMAPLQDGVPPRPFSEIRGIVEASIGAPLDTLFASFEERPLGAASIAQAHYARLLDGSLRVILNRSNRS